MDFRKNIFALIPKTDNIEKCRVIKETDLANKCGELNTYNLAVQKQDTSFCKSAGELKVTCEYDAQHGIIWDK